MGPKRHLRVEEVGVDTLALGNQARGLQVVPFVSVNQAHTPMGMSRAASPSATNSRSHQRLARALASPAGRPSSLHPGPTAPEKGRCNTAVRRRPSTPFPAHRKLIDTPSTYETPFALRRSCFGTRRARLNRRDPTQFCEMFDLASHDEGGLSRSDGIRGLYVFSDTKAGWPAPLPRYFPACLWAAPRLHSHCQERSRSASSLRRLAASSRSARRHARCEQRRWHR